MYYTKVVHLETHHKIISKSNNNKWMEMEYDMWFNNKFKCKYFPKFFVL